MESQAQQFLNACSNGEGSALNEWKTISGIEFEAATARLTDAQQILAQAYGLPGWKRLITACEMTDAMWRDDLDTIMVLINETPSLLHEDARGVEGNWGLPLSYAANVGRDRIVRALLQKGATDIQYAFNRACLQGKLSTAAILREAGAQPQRGIVMGACETLNADGLEYLLKSGAELVDKDGDQLAPLALMLQTYCRYPYGKHRCLDLASGAGITLPDTPVMALHAGRIDLLERHLQNDPDLLFRTFSHSDIYPPELGCSADNSLALHGTPLAGATLLHIAVDYDELDIARWLLQRGAMADTPAEIDGEGYGGHTALFCTVVSQAYRVGIRTDDIVARMLLDADANPHARASLRKQLSFVKDETLHEYRDVTPVEWGHSFHDQDWVSPAALSLISYARANA
jgi:ankyrin repeat protein